MGIAFLYGNGGGGASLNFNIVGNPQPVSPKENTIWVNTDVEITSWVFSAEEPSPAEEGMVWISIDTSSPVEFNALKKNGIQVYPISAKQYVGGAWVSKTAKSYQNGAWVEWWNGELYRYGNQYEYVTGGWSAVSGDIEFRADNIYIAGNDSYSEAVCTNESIDLSKWNTLVVKGNKLKAYSGGGICFHVGVTSTRGGDYITNIDGYGTGDFTEVIDISAVDSGYIQMDVGHSYDCIAQFNEVLLVR